MRFLEFKQQFKDFNIIKHQDILNVFKHVNQSQLSLWKRKKYLKSARKGMYVLSDVEIDNLLMANELNNSYISLEFALSYYQIIPEITPSITSVSNERSEDISNGFGNFYYHKIAPKLFCGFNLTESPIKKGRFIRIAEKEKALFDLIYFRPDLKDKNDFESLRLNIDEIKIVNMQKFIDLIAAPQIKKRLNNFINYLNAIV